MKGWALTGLLVAYFFVMLFVIFWAATYIRPHFDHSKDKFCNTLPVQCVEPAHR